MDGSAPTPYVWASQPVEVAVGGGALDFSSTMTFRRGGGEVGFVPQKGWLDPSLTYLALETTAPDVTQYYPGGEVEFRWFTPAVSATFRALSSANKTNATSTDNSVSDVRSFLRFKLHPTRYRNFMGQNENVEHRTSNIQHPIPNPQPFR